MAQNDRDVTEKRLEEYPDVFADVVNVILFDGERVILPEDLISMVPRSIYKPGSGLREQERDVSKFWKHGCVCLSFFGLENQTDILT